MIKQSQTGLNSRSEANPYNSDGFLPLITAPMYSVVDDTSYQIFLDNKIQVCLPRNKNVPITDAKYFQNSQNNGWNYIFESVSLSEFIEHWVENKDSVCLNSMLCIDTANGNIPQLHEAIRKAKEIHGSNLIIMAGNVSSVEAFVELAKTGVDYIRVGIGGGGGCHTTSNTGVGQEDLSKLIEQCYKSKYYYTNLSSINPSYWVKEKQILQKRIDLEIERREHNKKFNKRIYGLVEEDQFKSWIEQNNMLKVKIVADGISSYITQCQTKYGFNDNGYAAINKLLFAGADLIMIGKLFAQCLESTGEKGYYNKPIFAEKEIIPLSQFQESPTDYFADGKLLVKYSGMSTQEEQVKYKNNLDNPISTHWKNYHEGLSDKPLKPDPNIKPSEGSVTWIPVRWTLNEWLHGSENQDSYPYLMGWVNSIKSAMSYCGTKTLTEFKNK